MAESHTPRRALKDLAVNTFGTPSASHPSSSNKRSMKRHIQEVDDPALPPLSTRPWPSNPAPRSSSIELQRYAPAPTSGTSPCAEPEDGGESPMEENTQDTSNDTLSTIADLELEGDTMDTQVTAATELSQITRPSSLSNAETLRLRLRLAMFRIETNQTDVPLSLLRIPSPNTPGESAPMTSSPSHDTPPRPTLLPAPILKPSGVPDLMITRPKMAISPSSPGMTTVIEELSPETFRTPNLPRHGREQTSSRPDDDPLSNFGKRRVEDSRLSSSAVKGHAASSLLDLRDDKR